MKRRLICAAGSTSVMSSFQLCAREGERRMKSLLVRYNG